MTANVEILGTSGEPIAGKVLILDYGAQSDYDHITAADALKYSEVRHQITEGVEYEYELPVGWSFEKHSTLYPSARHPNAGRLRTGNQVGLLHLNVWDGVRVVGCVDLQIRSRKLNYRTEYRQMLEDIAEAAAELAMSTSELTYQKFDVDPSSDKKTRYEQFAFVRALIGSENFSAAIAKICASPLTAMKNVVEERRTDSLRRMGRDVVRQLASGLNRVELPVDHPLRVSGVLKDLPRNVSVTSRVETVDVIENRFVKYVLETFMFFALDIAAVANDDSRLQFEARGLADQLETLLLEPLFKEVSRLDRMAFSSPALQRREGYREVLRAWLMFEMAAKIASWRESEKQSA